MKLDNTKLEGRAVRVKRSVKKEKQKNKAENKAVNRRPVKKTPGFVRGFKPPKKFSGTQESTGSSKSFSGEMVHPSKKAKKKGLKKKNVGKPRKAVHI